MSNTACFKHPGEAIVRKYSLATMHLPGSDGEGLFAHVVVMPHATREVLDAFLGDLRKQQQ